MPKSPDSSYGQILKSSAVIGGSSVIVIGFGILRTKLLAVLLGPSGVGLVGMYSSIVELAKAVAGMGINSSAVRQIAESIGTGDEQRVARTVLTLRRVAMVMGAGGALALLALSPGVARLTFGDSRHAGGVALLSLSVICGVISAAQAALVQGMRRVGDLARLSVLGAGCGTFVGLPVVCLLGEEGIPLFLLITAGVSVLASWWYSSKIQLKSVFLRWSEMRAEAAALLKLGFVFMSTGLLTLGSAYLIRTFVLRKMGAEAAGFYHAAWTLAGLYISFILQAMGADFYPRLTAIARDHRACNKLVNEQTEVGLLVAVPGILGTLTFAPLVIHLFYSGKFEPASDLLRWNCLGMLLRVACWPMGFIVLAKGARWLFMLTETLSSVSYLFLVWAGVSMLGLNGTGVAFFGQYVFYFVLIYFVANRLSGFRWSSASRNLALLSVPLVAVVFVAGRLIPGYLSLAVGAVITAAAAYYSLKTVGGLTSLDSHPPIIRKLASLLRVGPSGRES